MGGDSRRDVLLVMSDQHNGRYVSMTDGMEDVTPNLAAIAEGGRSFDDAYCNAPLCVPSRSSFLQGRLPSETRVLDNDSTLSSDALTIAHEMGARGYRTVLVGRMHFRGPDQFHGFDERYVGDITSQYWGMSRDDIGSIHRAFKVDHCQEVVGEGDTPVTDYDEQVFAKACELLAEPRTEPLFMVVGFYAPHFPFVGKAADAALGSSVTEVEVALEPLPAYRRYCQDTSYERVEQINEAYKRMVMTIDRYAGGLFEAFRRRSDGLYVYTSDHGDQLGMRSLFGKKTLYEDSIRIPLVIDGVVPEVQGGPVDLLQLRRLLLAYAEGAPCVLGDAPVRVQTVLDDEHGPVWGEAVLRGRYKLVDLGGERYLYDIEDDPLEQRDLLAQAGEGGAAGPAGEDGTAGRLEASEVARRLAVGAPCPAGEAAEVAGRLAAELTDDEAVEECLAYVRRHRADAKVLTAYGKAKELTYDSRFEVQDEFRAREEYEYTEV